MKRMSVRRFREIGLLQEINRRFLHPMGLALEVIQDLDGSESFREIWDCMHDPEGIAFAEPPDPSKAEAIEALFKAKVKARKEILGFLIQPVKRELAAEPPDDQL